MSQQEMFADTGTSTSSRGSEDGLAPFVLQDGMTADEYGPALAPANPSVALARDAGLTTTDTCGPSSPDSSGSADLQRCLESRLRHRLDVNGSPEYALTWKSWDMRSGPPICALRASRRRISDSGCIGWPTPVVNDTTGSQYAYASGDHNRPCLKLPGAAMLAGWATPTTRDWKDGAECQNVPENALLGRQAFQSSAATGSTAGYRLNASFSLWLQGYNPDVWASCAVRGMPSSRK
jgi:hypothetical protein